MDKLLSALAAAINSRASPLQMLAPIKYHPGRELRPQTLPGGLISVTAAKRGYEYKHRGRLPQALPPADTEQIRKALNTAIAPRYAVREIIEQQKTITVILEEIS